MIFQIEWTKRGLEDLERLDKEIAQRIFKKVDNLRESFKSVDIKRVQGTNSFRLRIGDYRIIFEIQGDKIYILKVGHRKNIYKF